MYKKIALFTLTIIGIALMACGPSEPEFIVKDEREVQGKILKETFPIANENRESTVYSDIAAKRDFQHNIDLNLTSNKVSRNRVVNRIYELYKIPEINDSKTCLVPVEVPPSTTHEYELEWIEILHEGVIEEGRSGGGGQLGTYQILISWNCQVVGVVAQ